MDPVSREQCVGIIRQRRERAEERREERARIRVDRQRGVERNVRIIDAARDARLRDLERIIRDNRLGRNIEPAVNGQVGRIPEGEPREREGRDLPEFAQNNVQVLAEPPVRLRVPPVPPVPIPAEAAGALPRNIDIPDFVAEVRRHRVPPVPIPPDVAGDLMNPEQPQIELLARNLDPLGGHPVEFLRELPGRRAEQQNHRLHDRIEEMNRIEGNHVDRVARLNVLGVALNEDANRLLRARINQRRMRAEHGPLFRQATIPNDEDDYGSQVASTTINVSIEGDVISYSSAPDQPSSVGLFIWGKCLKPESNFFEIEILDRGESRFGESHSISIGVVNIRFPLDTHIGRAVDSESIAYHTGEGTVYHGGPKGKKFGERCEIGDKIGCGIRFPSGMKHSSAVSGSATDGASIPVQVFFTRNGKEIPSSGHNMQLNLPPHGFFPAISMNQSGEEIGIKLPGSGVRWAPEEDIMMLVDSAEDDWLRLHDIRLNGPILEYIGRGKSLEDVGLAQAKSPICTRNHYFEIEIVDPGSSCFIAIGLARKDYPKNRHPGWNKGSIAYHADDGKVFVGSGVGAPFGPRCHRGDIMGCGVLFPRNYECKSDSEEELEQQGGVDQYGARAGVVAGIPDRIQPGPEAGGGVVIGHNYVQLDYASDSGEDDDWWNDRNYTQSGVKVEIYFTRNGNVIGKKDIRIPKGGFYPTVGMMSCDEKVRVDLRPLSG